MKAKEAMPKVVIKYDEEPIFEDDLAYFGAPFQKTNNV